MSGKRSKKSNSKSKKKIVNQKQSKSRAATLRKRQKTDKLVTQDDLTFMIRNNKKEKLFVVEVPFPKHYPNTKFKEREESIASISMWYKNAPHSIYIASFYVYAAEISSRALQWERELVRGLGRKMMCLALSKILELGIMPETGFVTLIAAGGDCNNKMLDDFAKKFSSLEAFNILQTKYPESDLILQTALNKLCYDVQNDKLVEYYKKTYGFSDWTEQEKWAGHYPLRTTLGNILTHCSK